MKISKILCTLFLFGAIVLSGTFRINAQSEYEITVFAASSLTDALTDVAIAFEDLYGIDIIFNFAGSSTLAAQIQEGAPAHIFASANMTQMQAVIDADLVDAESVQILAENQLVIIVPADNPAEILSAQDLAENEHLLVMASQSVPIRVYTDELLGLLADEYGADYLDAVLANVISEEPNVRQVVARIVLGEADAAIVYRTDVTPDIADAVTIIALPENIESPIAQYPIAPLIDAPNPEQAALFIDFVLSDAGQEIMQSWGFCSPHISSIDDIIPDATEEATPEVTPEIEVEDNFCA